MAIRWVDFQGQHVVHYENGEAYFMHANNVGTTAFVTDYSGAVVEDQTHYPWGQVWADQGGIEERFAQMQHRDEETDLDPTHFRMYSSTQGRWLSPDPVRPCPHHPQEFDRYQYAANNPTNRIDPKGTCVSQAFCEASFTLCMTEAENTAGECEGFCQAGFDYCLLSGRPFVECLLIESACIGGCVGTGEFLEYECRSAYEACLADVCPVVRPRPPRPVPR
jgi:RHS repeat-associated protein